MFEPIYTFFNDSGLLTIRSILSIFLVTLVTVFFAVFIGRAIKVKFASRHRSNEIPDSEQTTEIVNVNLDQGLK